MGQLHRIRGVTNEITIHTNVDSHKIQEQIQSAFSRHAQREASRVVIDVNGGIVTLRGAVDSMAEHDAAVGTAKAAPGVAKVVDRLLVAA